MKIRILLVEPDFYSRYPPLGLLKIATLHRSRGDEVMFVRGNQDVGFHPDKIYVTSLFTYSWRPVHEAVRFYKTKFKETPLLLGGIYASLLPKHAARSGADEIHVGLLADAEDLVPAWDLVPHWDGSIIFASRGCIRNCSFCSVPRLEGRPSALKHSIRKYIWPKHTRVILWDNNILGNANWVDIASELAELKLVVDFNQGLDARLLTDKVAEHLARLRLTYLRLAYDNRGVGPSLEKALERLEAAGMSRRKTIVYTLYNYSDDPEDFFRRVTDILSWGAVSYPMRFEPLTTLRKNAYVSPNWTMTDLESVAKARRVLGYSGALPPYEGLVRKFTRAKSFERAFSLRKEQKRKKGKRARNHVHPRWGGGRDWRSVGRKPW